MSVSFVIFCLLIVTSIVVIIIVGVFFDYSTVLIAYYCSISFFMIAYVYAIVVVRYLLVIVYITSDIEYVTSEYIIPPKQIIGHRNAIRTGESPAQARAHSRCNSLWIFRR